MTSLSDFDADIIFISMIIMVKKIFNVCMCVCLCVYVCVSPLSYHLLGVKTFSYHFSFLKKNGGASFNLFIEERDGRRAIKRELFGALFLCFLSDTERELFRALFF